MTKKWLAFDISVKVGFVALFVVIAILSGCGGSNDAGTSSRDTGPAEKINFPNHFATVADKCDHHGHRVFLVDHGNSQNGGGGLAVVPDRTCS